jgi:hypothetical protein
MRVCATGVRLQYFRRNWFIPGPFGRVQAKFEGPPVESLVAVDPKPGHQARQLIKKRTL